LFILASNSVIIPCMSKVESRYTPLPQASSPLVKFELNLPPYIDQNQIGVNLKAIHSLCRLGGIEHLRIISNTKGDTSTEIPQTAGYDSQGSAYGSSKISRNIVSPQDSSFGPSWYGPIHAADWIGATIDVNINEVIFRMNNDKRWKNKGIRSLESWSHFLNQAMKQEVSTIGTKNLMSGLRTNDGVAMIIIDGLTTATGFGFPFPQFLGLSPLESGPMIVMAGNAFANMVTWRFYELNQNRWSNVESNRYRLSLFYGIQPDRALALQLLAKTSTLVKSLEMQTK